MATGKAISLDGAGPGELITFDTLRESLPASWHVVWGRDIPTGLATAMYRETDFIIMGDNVLFIVEEKHWWGTYTGNAVHWYRHDGETRDSPLKQALDLTKKLSGLIKKNFPGIASAYSEYNAGRGGVGIIPTAIPHVILSESTCDFSKVNDPRIHTDCSALGDAATRLQAIDAAHPGLTALHTPATRRALVDYLDGLSERPARTSIGAYAILESIPSADGVRRYLARHANGAERVLTVLSLGDLPDPAADVQKRVNREVAALEKLWPTGLVPRAYDYLLADDDKLLVIPSDPVTSRRSMASLMVEHGPPQVDEFLELAAKAFDGLQAIHDNDVLHRSLRPECVWLPLPGDDDAGVVFTDFTYARLGGTATLPSNVLANAEDPYCAPEVAASLQAASPASDAYSLAAAFAGFLSAIPFSAESPAIEVALAELPTEARDAFTQALSSDPGDRPKASTIATACREDSSLQSSDLKLPSRYEIEEELGSGATANTYRVTDPDDLIAPTRVLKVFSPTHSLDLVKAELAILQAVQHENIVRSFGHGGRGLKADEHDTLPYLVYGYLEGQTLAEYGTDSTRATGSDSIGRTRTLLIQGLGALSYLHEKGRVHRDIKPRNLFIHTDESGKERLVLIDFGQACDIGTTGVAGTPHFLDPQVHGHGPWYPTSDLFALAASFYLAVTGLLPFELDRFGNIDTATSRGLVGDDPASRVLQQRLLRALSPELTDRYPTAEAFREALEEPIQVELQPVARELERHVNPHVDELRRYYRNSRLGNGANRGLGGAFGEQTYVRTRLDEVLMPAILDGKYAVVLFAGNPGDGKTAFLEQFAKHLDALGATTAHDNQGGWERAHDGRRYVAVNDASASFDGQSADEYVMSVLDELAGYSGEPTDFTILIAANDGRLLDLFNESPYHQYVSEAVETRLLGTGTEADAAGVEIVDFKTRALADGEDAERSILVRTVRAATAPKLWNECERCRAAEQCPIRFNALSMGAHGDDSPARRLHDQFRIMHLRRKARLTMRDARSVVSYAVTADLSCDEVHSELERGESPLSHERLYFWLLTAGPPAADIGLDQLHELDPDLHANPQVDRALNQLVGRTWTPLGPADLDERTGRPVIPTSLFRTSEADEVNRRRFFFEGDLAALLETATAAHTSTGFSAYHHLDQFGRLVTGNIHVDDLAEVLRGLSRVVGVFGFSDEGLAIRPVVTTAESDAAVVKIFDRSSFELLAPSVPSVVEQLVDQLVLRHVDGAPSIRLSLDAYELLARSAKGYVATHPEALSLVEEMRVFARQILQLDNSAISVIDPAGNAAHVEQVGSRILLEER